MGSNLNLSGEIECDASIMDGKSLHYGAVGAIRGEILHIYVTLLCCCSSEVRSHGAKLLSVICFIDLLSTIAEFVEITGENWHHNTFDGGQLSSMEGRCTHHHTHIICTL